MSVAIWYDYINYNNTILKNGQIIVDSGDNRWYYGMLGKGGVTISDIEFKKHILKSIEEHVRIQQLCCAKIKDSLKK